MNIRLKIFITLILVNILIPIKSSAEILANNKFENISIDEGLSNEHVTAIFQDSKGYMWIGTEDGLNRYDGKTIKIYNCNNENNDNTLSSTYINDIDEDDNGNIWIATDYGLDVLIVEEDRIIRMKDGEDSHNLGRMKITALLNSSYDENIMWVGTEDGLIKIDIENKISKAFYHESGNPYSLTNSSITCLEEGEDNSLLVGTTRGINIIDKDLKINSNHKNRPKNKLYIYNIVKNGLGKIWLSTKEGIFVGEITDDRNTFMDISETDSSKKFNMDNKDIYPFKYRDIKLYNNFIFKDNKNNIWLSSNKGVIRYSRDKEEVDIFDEDINSNNSISSNVITCFYEDFNGTIWIGTDKGANILNDNNIFDYINKEHEKNIVSILKHNDYIWVATKFNGVHIYDAKNGEKVSTLDKEKDSSIGITYIKSLFKINEKNIIISTNKEIIALNVEKKLRTEIMIGEDYSSELEYIYSDGNDIWIASTTRFYSYNMNTGKKTYYDEDFRSLDIHPGNIRYILPDDNNKNIIWLGGIDIGLIKYHKQEGIIERYTNNKLDKNSLINNYINCMIFDKSGDLWIGTNIGISKFDVDTKKFTSYTTHQGVSNNFIKSMLIDNNGDIWISTNKGLNKYDIKSEKFTKFMRMDSIYGYQFNLNSSLKLENGHMIFGSTEGYTYFNPDDLVDYKKHKNKVIIGDIYIEKNKVIYDGEELVLNHNYKNLYINYFLPNYETLNNITYEYMLEGIDSDWIYVDGKNWLDFKSLEPGKYNIKIRARCGHGELTDETNINIRVKQPIWKTPLAYMIYISIILAWIVYLLNRVKILNHLVDQKTIKLNKELERNKELSKEIIEFEKLKNNYFVNLSHELRTPINIILSAIQLINSLEKRINYEKFKEYMGIIEKSSNNLLYIINDIIDSSKIETGKYKINKKNNDIVFIVEEAALNMCKFIEDNGLSLIIDPDMEEKIISCDKIEIERCITNLLSNSVKYTEEGGEIRVYIKEIESNVEITVEDTGIGISKEDQEFIFKRFSQVDDTLPTKVSSSGIGLTLVKDIIELHGGYITLESEINVGSRFTIVIPDIKT